MQGLRTWARQPLRAGHKVRSFSWKRSETGELTFFFFTTCSIADTVCIIYIMHTKYNRKKRPQTKKKRHHPSQHSPPPPSLPLNSWLFLSACSLAANSGICLPSKKQGS